MIGFTIVLGRKRKTFKKRKNKMNFRIKKQYLLLIIFLITVIITASFFVEKNEAKTETIEVTTKSVNAFKEINDYSAYYIPVVINNFASYKKGENIGNDMVIKLGIWSILSVEEKEGYEAFGGKLYIPAEDVKNSVFQLFAEDVHFENKSVKTEKYVISFDENTGCYIVPTIGFSPEFTPVLESVVANTDCTVLTVGCLRGENYKQDSSGNTVAPEAEKRIFITLKKTNKGYYIEEISEE